jgi:hypothetical protein
MNVHSNGIIGINQRSVDVCRNVAIGDLVQDSHEVVDTCSVQHSYPHNRLRTPVVEEDGILMECVQVMVKDVPCRRLWKALISNSIGSITDGVASVQVVLEVSVELVASSCGVVF